MSGAVTLNGASLAGNSTTTSRGKIVFVGAGGQAPATVYLGTSGAVNYPAEALAATYDVTFVGNNFACENATSAATLPPVPCNSGPLRRAIPLAASGVLDLDVPVIRVSGTVTLDGLELGAETGSRGALTFDPGSTPTGATTGAGAASLGTTGPGNYAVSLLPGTYDVLFAAANLCGDSTAQPKLPCVGGRVKTGATNLDGRGAGRRPSRRVGHGRVTLRGADLPAMPLVAPGAIVFTGPLGGSAGVSLRAPTGGAPTTYSMPCLPAAMTSPMSRAPRSARSPVHRRRCPATAGHSRPRSRSPPTERSISTSPR